MAELMKRAHDCCFAFFVLLFTREGDGYYWVCVAMMIPLHLIGARTFPTYDGGLQYLQVASCLLILEFHGRKRYIGAFAVARHG
jgi:hypothetical protein